MTEQEQSLSDRLYGKSEPEAAPQKSDDAPAETPETALAERLYDKPEAKEAAPAEKPVEKPAAQEGEFKIEIPENIAKLREGDNKLLTAEGLYRGQDGLEATFEGAEVAPEVQKTAIQEFRQMAQDFQLEPPQFALVVPLVKEFTAAPADEATRGAWRKEAVLSLEQTYGKEDAAKALQDARALVQRDPRIARLLNDSGLGSHPKIVLLLVEKARAAKIAGRL